MADSEKKLCRQVSEFSRMCEGRKLRVNAGKSEVMRRWRYGEGGPLHSRLNDETLEVVDFFCTWDCKLQRMEDVKGM